jgi:hypothetical protein
VRRASELLLILIWLVGEEHAWQRPRRGGSLAGRMLARRMLAARILARRMLAARMLAARMLAWRLLAARILTGRILAGGLASLAWPAGPVLLVTRIRDSRRVHVGGQLTSSGRQRLLALTLHALSPISSLADQRFLR